MDKNSEFSIDIIVEQKKYEETMKKLQNICEQLKQIAELQEQICIPESAIAVLNNPKKLILRTDLVIREEERKREERKLSRQLGVDIVILPPCMELIAAESE